MIDPLDKNLPAAQGQSPTSNAEGGALAISRLTMERFTSAFRAMDASSVNPQRFSHMSVDELDDTVTACFSFLSWPLPTIVAWEEIRIYGHAGQFELVAGIASKLPEYDTALLEPVPPSQVQEVLDTIPALCERAGDEMMSSDGDLAEKCYQAAFDLRFQLLVDLFCKNEDKSKPLELGADAELRRLVKKGAVPKRCEAEFEE